MAKKKKFYVIYSPEFQGIVETLKEYNKHVVKKKDAFGKSFTSKDAADGYLTELKQHNGNRKNQKLKYYAIYGPLFTGIVYSKIDFDKYVVGQKKMHGKQVKSKSEGEAWIRKHNKTKPATEAVVQIATISVAQPKKLKEKQSSKVNNVVAKPSKEILMPIEKNMSQQCVLYIDGSFKDGIGKYGLLAYVSTWEKPILKDFGFVYDDSFNSMMNTGAELMACMRGLEWAYANGMNKVVIVYDYEGIVRLQKSMSEQRAVQMFTKMMVRFKQVMDVQFIHVRHSNRELHNAVHELTQLVL